MENKKENYIIDEWSNMAGILVKWSQMVDLKKRYEAAIFYALTVVVIVILVALIRSIVISA